MFNFCLFVLFCLLLTWWNLQTPCISISHWMDNQTRVGPSSLQLENQQVQYWCVGDKWVSHALWVKLSQRSIHCVIPCVGYCRVEKTLWEGSNTGLSGVAQLGNCFWFYYACGYGWWRKDCSSLQQATVRSTVPWENPGTALPAQNHWAPCVATSSVCAFM